MSDFTAAVPAQFEPEGLLQTVLDVSLSALLVLRPQYGPPGATDEVIDFALEYLNPAGQQLLTLPAHPGGTLSSRFSATAAPTLVAFCRRQFDSAPAAQLDLPYPGLAHPLRVAARRHGEYLIVSFLASAPAALTTPAPAVAPHQPLPALADVNEELRATNERLRASNLELRDARHQLHQLNEQLETQAVERARELHQARAEAAQQQQRLNRFFTQAPAAICVLNGPELVFELVNPAYQQLFTGRELLHRRLDDALPELVDSPVRQTLQQVYETGETYEGIGALVPMARTAGGPMEDYYFHFIQQARYNEQGKIDGVIVFAIDMTEQMQVRQRAQALRTEVVASTRRLAQERETFYQAFARTPAAICILHGPEHRLQYFNASYEQLFPGRQLRGRTVAEVQPEAVEQGFVALLDQVYRTGEAYYGTEMPLLLRDPDTGITQQTYFNFTYQAYQQNGETVGISVFAYDVTEQVRARQQMQQLNQQLQDANEQLQQTNQELIYSNVDLDNFIYTASHDLKAPITNIEGLLHTLTAEMPAEQQPTEVSYILELMQESVERFKKTIENLTDVARLRQEQLPTATMVNLREVLLDVQLDLAPLIHDSGAHITRRLTDYATVVFSPKNLRSVLYNLLSNALKYHAPDRPPRITISTRREGEFLVLEVQDNGLGLPENSRGRLFGMFQRFHSHVEGTGIGLYMVRKMVENAGGHLEVSSEEGVGSTFSVYFRQ